jgi:hypothetical protein
MNNVNASRENLKVVPNERVMHGLLKRFEEGLHDLGALTSRVASVGDHFHGQEAVKGETKAGAPSPSAIVPLMQDALDAFDRLRETLTDEVKRLEVL